MEVTLAYPEGYELPEWVIEQARAKCRRERGSIRISHDIRQAFEDADVVIPRTGKLVRRQQKGNRGKREGIPH